MKQDGKRGEERRAKKYCKNAGSRPRAPSPFDGPRNQNNIYMAFVLLGCKSVRSQIGSGSSGEVFGERLVRGCSQRLWIYSPVEN